MKKRRYFLLLIGILSSCGSIGTSPSDNSISPTEPTLDISNSEEIPSEEISNDVDSSLKESSEVEITNTVETWKILEDSIYETTVYKFTSNVPGKRCAIVGGIHGDEVAGWKAALQLKERRDFIGEVLIIPQASIYACKREERYPGYGDAVNGIKYKDLNRNFPGNPNGNVTEKIADAIAQTVKDFDADIIVDLHESRRSYSDSDPLLGDLLIYGNVDSSLFCYDLVNEFNKSYLKEGEVNFSFDTNAPGGAFNQYFGDTYPNAIVFTVETNRQLEEARRIEQQTQILDLLFETIWN